MSEDENPVCDNCGKEIVKPPAGKNLTSKGLHRGGKVFCCGHCEIEDWWDDPSPSNSYVEL